MEKICADVLDAWAKYINYEKGNISVTLNPEGIALMHAHDKTESLAHIINDYDETGLLAVMTAKSAFGEILDASLVSLKNVLRYPEELEKHAKMDRLFNDPKLTEAERRYTDRIKDLIIKTSGRNLLGNFDDEAFAAQVFGHTNAVVKALDKCRFELYKPSGLPIGDIANFSTNINIFPTLADCLLTLEKAPDGLYTCYIDVHQSADSYFGFFVKSEGNIFSVNERADEAYKGQHAHSRNGRWAEAKADDIFPYDYIFSYGEHDYKGYAHSYKIDENCLSIFNMEQDAYIPMLVAMALISRKYSGRPMDDVHVTYVDSFLKVNIPTLTGNGTDLAVIGDSQLATITNNINLDFDQDKLMSGAALKEFRDPDNNIYTISANNSGQLFVDLYGEGFKYEPVFMSSEKLLAADGRSYVPEFVGDEHRLRAQAYIEVREQLAEYIWGKIYEEYKAFGGVEAAEKWLEDSVKANADRIKQIAMKEYIEYKAGKKQNVAAGWWPSEAKDGWFTTISEESRIVSTFNYGKVVYPLNKIDESGWKAIDMDNGKPCNISVVFRFTDYHGLENLFQCEVPKIIKGWTKSYHTRNGNSLLDMTDAVEAVNSPFAHGAYIRPEYKKDDSKTGFVFVIAFSKSGLSAYCRSLGLNLAKAIEKRAQDPDKKPSGTVTTIIDHL